MTSNDCSTLCTKCTSTCGPRIGVWWASFEEFTALCNLESTIVREKALIPNYVVQRSRMNTSARVAVTPGREKGFVLRCEVVGVRNSATIAVTSDGLTNLFTNAFFTHFPVSSMDVELSSPIVKRLFLVWVRVLTHMEYVKIHFRARRSLWLRNLSVLAITSYPISSTRTYVWGWSCISQFMHFTKKICEIHDLRMTGHMQICNYLMEFPYLGISNKNHYPMSPQNAMSSLDRND